MIPGNIKAGIQILGVTGEYAGEADKVQTKTVTPTKDGLTVTPDPEYDYLSQVTVNAIPYSEADNPQGGKTVQSGDNMGINKVDYFGETHIDLTEDTVTADALKKGITAHAKNGEQIIGKYETKLQSKSATPTKSAQTIKPDSGYDGLSQVAVGAIPSDYIIPSGTLTITSNGTKDVKNYASVNVNVNVPVPSGYINIADTLNYCTKLKYGEYTPTSDVLISSSSISGIGFKPKIFLMHNYSGLKYGSKNYGLTTWTVLNNNFERMELNDSFYSGGTNQLSTSGQSSTTRSAKNHFMPTTNGMTGSGTSTVYLRGGYTYHWFALG